MENTFCSNCGAEMVEGQQFCSNCGQKKEMVVDNEVSMAIAQFNENLVQEKKSKGLKKWLAIGIPAAAATLVLLIVLIVSLSNRFGGRYVYASGGTGYTYTFDKGRYWYTTEDDQETGTYSVNKKIVTLTDEDGNTSTYARKGKFLYGTKACYDELFNSHASEQTFTKTSSFKYNGDYLTYKCEFVLYADGTYSFESKLGSGSVWVDVSEDYGRYQVQKDRILLYPDGETHVETYLIIDGKVYDSVFKKQ